MLINNSELDEITPLDFYLSQNYPNPFKESTVIKYCVGYKTRVHIIIYNSFGDVIEELLDEEKKPGTYEITWNASDLPGGIYYYKIIAGEFTQKKKMELLE